MFPLGWTGGPSFAAVGQAAAQFFSVRAVREGRASLAPDTEWIY